MTFSQFFSACDKLVARHGQQRGARVDGAYRSDALVVDTPGLKVAKDSGQAFEVELRYTGLDGSTTKNPVVLRNIDGELYRVHCEWQLGVARLKRLLAGETPKTPIRVGRDDRGFLAGVD